MHQIIQLPFSCGSEWKVDNLTFFLTFLPSSTFNNILQTVIRSYDKINVYFHITFPLINSLIMMVRNIWFLSPLVLLKRNGAIKFFEKCFYFSYLHMQNFVFVGCLARYQEVSNLPLSHRLSRVWKLNYCCLGARKLEISKF